MASNKSTALNLPYVGAMTGDCQNQAGRAHDVQDFQSIHMRAANIFAKTANDRRTHRIRLAC